MFVYSQRPDKLTPSSSRRKKIQCTMTKTPMVGGGGGGDADRVVRLTDSDRVGRPVHKDKDAETRSDNLNQPNHPLSTPSCRLVNYVNY